MIKKIVPVVPIVLIVILIGYTAISVFSSKRSEARTIAAYQKLRAEHPEESEQDAQTDENLYSSKSAGTSFVLFLNNYLQQRQEYQSNQATDDMDEVDLQAARDSVASMEKRYADFVYDDSLSVADWFFGQGNQLIQWDFVVSGDTKEKVSDVMFLGSGNGKLYAVVTGKYDGEKALFGDLSLHYTMDSGVYGDGQQPFRIREASAVTLLLNQAVKVDGVAYEGQGNQTFDHTLFSNGVYKDDTDTMSDGLVVMYQK